MKIVKPLAAFEADPRIAPWIPFVATVTDVLTAAECGTLVERIEAIGPEVATVNRGTYQEVDRRIRDNDRVIFDDVALAADLHARLGPAIPPEFGARRAAAASLNERFRCYRYTPGQRFAPHYDGAVARGGEESEITVLLYLNDDCEGGETAFPEHGLRIRPERGMALLFQHAVLHEGCPVALGRKYVLRTDVMYKGGR